MTETTPTTPAAETTTLLELLGVSARPDGADADVIVDIDLRFVDRSVTAILGASGSGKSTLLRAIVGLVPLTAGRLLLDDIDITSVPTHRRDIGLMFQDHALFPHLDVANNVVFGLRMHRVARVERDARVAEVLELVGLAGFGERTVSSLSGGERQRVALARAMAPSPRVLLLDEPMGSLDRALREDLVAELAVILRATATTALYVTHDHAEATALADRIVILDDGRVVQEGTVAAVRAAPVDAHAARLLGLA